MIARRRRLLFPTYSDDFARLATQFAWGRCGRRYFPLRIDRSKLHVNPFAPDPFESQVIRHMKAPMIREEERFRSVWSNIVRYLSARRLSEKMRTRGYRSFHYTYQAPSRWEESQISASQLCHQLLSRVALASVRWRTFRIVRTIGVGAGCLENDGC